MYLGEEEKNALAKGDASFPITNPLRLVGNCHQVWKMVVTEGQLADSVNCFCSYSDFFGKVLMLIFFIASLLFSFRVGARGAQLPIASS